MTRRRVQGFTHTKLLSVIDSMEKRVGRSMDAVLRRVTANLGQHNLRAALVATGGFGDPNIDDLGAIRLEWTEEVDGVIQPYVIEMYDASALEVVTNIEEAFPSLAGSIPLLPSETAEDILGMAHNRLVGVGNDIWEAARTELVNGLSAGESMEQLRDRIRGVGQFTEGRAMNIARTEVMGAVNAASLRQTQFTGLRGIKYWLATDDARTRMSHHIADGQVVPLGDYFRVGADHLQYPGDPSGPPSEIVNCRCTLTYDLDGPERIR